MSSEQTPQLVEDKAVLPLELFFDLVFVLGITQTVALVIDGHDMQALFRAGLVLAMLWWGVAAWVVLLVCTAAPGTADDVGGGIADRIFEPGAPVEIDADSLEYESGRDLYVARGSVTIRQEEREPSQ